MTTGSDLKERVQVQSLLYYPEANVYAWEVKRSTWAAAEQDTRKNLFSSVGIGARGVTFTLRRNPELTIVHSFLWRGQFCFLTSIVDGDPGFQVVQAALCDLVDCIKDADMETQGCRFPGILTEKYVGHEQLDPHAEVTGDLVLVTPKVVSLKPDSWVLIGDRHFLVRIPHELDRYKNEYEIRRTEDC
nr:hypothetical protein [uncultured Oscillibacter sp.]